MGFFSILVLVVFVSTVVSTVWRTNLVLNHPEKAERFASMSSSGRKTAGKCTAVPLRLSVPGRSS